MVQRFVSRARTLTARVQPHAVVLVYHRVVSVASDPWGLAVSPEHFSQQLRVLREQATPISMRRLSDELKRGRLTRRTVAVTFDDGYGDNLTGAMPALVEHGIPATIFIPTGIWHEPGGFWWDRLEQLVLHPGQLPEHVDLQFTDMLRTWDVGDMSCYSREAFELARGWRAWTAPENQRQQMYVELWRLLHECSSDERRSILGQLEAISSQEPHQLLSHSTLTEQQLLTMRASGLIEFGAHTVTHPSLARLSRTEQTNEIRSSKRTLEDILNQPVESFAYPFGRMTDYTSDTVALVRDASFTIACANVSGRTSASTDPLQLPRMHVDDWNGAEFAVRLAQWLRG